MSFLSKIVKTGLVVGAAITAWQATQKTKRETGAVTTDAFVKNFKDQALENSRLVVDTVKSKLNGQDGDYRVSDEGENGYTYVDAGSTEPKPAADKVSEVFETMKEKAPEVIGKVQNIVEDVRENAPEYKARAQEFVEDVKEAAKKALDKDDKGE
jgi:hypothetical protein